MSILTLDAARKERLLALQNRLEADLASAGRTLLEHHPLEAFIDELDQHGRVHTCYQIAPEALARCKAISERFSPARLEAYLQFVLVRLMRLSDVRSSRHRLVDSVKPLILENFDRILSDLERPRPGYFSLDKGPFKRDLAACRLKLLPCGVEMIDVGIGVPRRLAVEGGVRQFLGFVAAFRLNALKPLYPVYETQWDRRMVRNSFTPRDYDLCYLRVAEMLKANPEVGGLVSTSWWFDPVLHEVAPELEFLRRAPERHGARFICMGTSNVYGVRDALALSPKRKALYEEGRYRPQAFMMVWMRKDMLAWAERKSNALVKGR